MLLRKPRAQRREICFSYDDAARSQCVRADLRAGAMAGADVWRADQTDRARHVCACNGVYSWCRLSCARAVFSGVDGWSS